MAEFKFAEIRTHKHIMGGMFYRFVLHAEAKPITKIANWKFGSTK